MNIVVAGQYPKQYSLEEIEADIKVICPEARVVVKETADEEDELVSCDCIFELDKDKSKPDLEDTIKEMLLRLNSLQSIFWIQDISSSVLFESLEWLVKNNNQTLRFGVHVTSNKQETGQTSRETKAADGFVIYGLKTKN